MFQNRWGPEPRWGSLWRSADFTVGQERESREEKGEKGTEETEIWKVSFSGGRR